MLSHESRKLRQIKWENKVILTRISSNLPIEDLEARKKHEIEGQKPGSHVFEKRKRGITPRCTP
jgi:hypothetical protein